MFRSKRRLAVLAVCGLALGVAALASSSLVQAEEGAKWSLINSKAELVAIPGANDLLPTVSIKEFVNSDVVLLFSTQGGTKVGILCTGGEFLNARLEGEGVVGGENITRFKGCVTLINGTISPSCSPHTGTEKGVLASTALKGSLMLFELGGGIKDTIILFEPVSGTTFMTVQFGEECAIGETCKITGKNSIKDAKGEFGTELVEHLVEQGPLNELSANGQPASVDGAGLLKLSGAHSGLQWAGTPG